MRWQPLIVGALIFVSQHCQAGDSPTNVGIEQREAWTTSRLTGSPEPPLPYRLERLHADRSWTLPVDFAVAPASDRWFIVELNGRIVSFDPHSDTEEDLFIDLKQHVGDFFRVYGLTFHPQFRQNRYCYICYVLQPDQEKGTRVSRFEVTNTDPPRCDPNTEEILIEWPSGGHNGGCLKFGPDGCLYITTGDGTPPSPPDGRDTGQDISDLMASILRIDVDNRENGRLYSIPADNPFVELADARPEIWAYGFRNPWKMSFDRKTGELWVGDVGWELWELVFLVERGGNYGWSIMEGRQPVRPEAKRGPTPILPPIADHPHTEARSVTGGHVYRGNRLKELQGAYIYGDYVTGKIWALRQQDGLMTELIELTDAPIQIITFGEDHAGELYVIGYDGSIHRLIPNDAARLNESFPRRLSETGLFQSVEKYETAAGVIPYSINAEPWEDGAVAQRHLAIPKMGTLGVYTAKEQDLQQGRVKGAWKFPTDSVFAKTLSLEMEVGNPNSVRRIETQILHRDGDIWRAYSYMWNDEQSDAVLVDAAGANRTFEIRDAGAQNGVRGQTWHFASRTECLLCHTTRAGSIRGFNVEQLDRYHRYGDREANQLATMSHLGLFEEPLPEKIEPVPDPHDESLDLETRARAYLHVNCATCHLRGGGGTAAFELQIELPLERTGIVSARPTQGTFRIHSPHVVSPGDPYRSLIYYRMSKLGKGRMPHIGSNVVDRNGLRLVHDWIGHLESSPNSPAEGNTVIHRLRSQQSLNLARLRRGESVEAAVDQLLETTSGGLRLVTLIDRGELADDVQTAVIARGTAHPEPAVRDLFERFLPEEKRTKTLGTIIEPEEILSLTGDSDRGQKLFLFTEGVQCKNCHRIGEEGKPLGPDLTKIGEKNNRAQLLESILEPSKKIDPKFVSYILESSAGRVYSGLLIERTADRVVLADGNNKRIEVPAAEVEQLVPQQKSLMPELLLRDLTAEQVADLLAYLESLK